MKSQSYFFDRDGTPLTGKTPLALRVIGAPTGAQIDAGVSFAQSVLEEVRLGGLQQLRKSATMFGGRVRATVHVCFGVTSVEIQAIPQPEEPRKEEAFFGGVAIQPSYLPDETLAFGPAEIDRDAPRTIIPEAEISGATVTKPGRPAVPGAEAVTTDWLVIQIVKDRPLTSEPIKNGTVKIFRAKDLKLGEVVEPSSTIDKYLLSAKSDFSEFYICGQQVTSIPPLPLTSEERGWTVARLRTINFVPDSFERAHLTRGVVIAAVDKKLFAVDTRAETPTWLLLHAATFDAPTRFINNFGKELSTIRNDDGSVSVLCHGTNNAGECSRFEIALTPVPDGLPALSGALYLEHDGSAPAVPSTISYSANLNVVQYATFATGPGPSFAHYTIRWGELHMTASATASEGHEEIQTDRFFGGMRPSYSLGAWGYTLTSDTVGTWTGGFAPLTAVTPWTYSFSKNAYIQGVRESARSSESSLEISSAANQATYLRTMGVVSTDLPPDPVLRYSLLSPQEAGDARVAWIRSAVRTGVLSPPPDISWDSDIASWGPEFSLDPDEDTAEYATYSPVTLSLSLMRNSGATIVEWSDVFTRFSVVPSWAGERVVSLGRRKKYDAPKSSGGASPTLAGIDVGGVARYDTWFPAVNMPRIGASDAGWSDALVPTGSTSTDGTFFEFTDSVAVDENTPRFMTLDEYSAFVRSSDYYQFYHLGGVYAPTHISVAAAAQRPWSSDNRGFSPPLIDEMNISMPIIEDPRTAGFVAESYLYFDDGTGTWHASLEQFIGNDFGVMPLRQVLDEWMALGELSSITPTKRVFATTENAFPPMGII